MRVSEIASFITGYIMTSLALLMLPTITLFPMVHLTYKDDDGVCYTYDRIVTDCS